MIAFYDGSAPAGAELTMAAEYTSTLSAALVEPERVAVAVYLCRCREHEGKAHFLFVENGVLVYDTAVCENGTAIPFGGDVSPIGAPEGMILQHGIRCIADELVAREIIQKYFLPTKRQQDKAQWN